MQEVLEKYIPEAAVTHCISLIKEHEVHLKIVNQRVTRHGDYRRMPNGAHQITVNASTNPYRFLMTLIHEIAHLVAFEAYGRQIKPHGIEWKKTFQGLMLPFIRPEVFPSGLLPLLAQHFKNPKASSDTDARLSLALSNLTLPMIKALFLNCPKVLRLDCIMVKFLKEELSEENDTNAWR